jgi:hypothetical protein
MYLYTLAQYHSHFSGRRAVYVEAEGLASSAAPETWPILVGALATTGPAELEQYWRQGCWPVSKIGHPISVRHLCSFGVS